MTLSHARGVNTDKKKSHNQKFLVMTFLKHKCMHENCLFDKAVGLSTICCGMKCFIFNVEFILSCKNSLIKEMLRK